VERALIAQYMPIKPEVRERLEKEGKYTYRQIDNRWTTEIEADFAKWLLPILVNYPILRQKCRNC